MRQKRENQLPLPGLWPDYRLAQELRAVSKILDGNPSILDLALHHLCDNATSGQGAPGLSAEQVLRAAIVKHRQQLPYSQLAFLLHDSQHVRRGQSPFLLIPLVPSLTKRGLLAGGAT